MKPNVREETYSGMVAAELEVSSQYLNNAITIMGLDTGIMTVRAKAADNPSFEYVLNGTINLGSNRLTLTILNTQIDAFEFTVKPEAAFTVRVKQTDGDTER